MEKTLIISGKSVNFKSTGAFLLRYKAQFGRDALSVLAKMSGAMDKETGKLKLETLDLTLFLEVIWTLAKTADPSIPEPMVWLDSFEEFPLGDILPQLQDLLTSTLQSSVKSKN